VSVSESFKICLKTCFRIFSLLFFTFFCSIFYYNTFIIHSSFSSMSAADTSISRTDDETDLVFAFIFRLYWCFCLFGSMSAMEVDGVVSTQQSNSNSNTSNAVTVPRLPTDSSVAVAPATATATASSTAATATATATATAANAAKTPRDGVALTNDEKAALPEFLSTMDDTEPTIPDEVIEYFMETSGCHCSDQRVYVLFFSSFLSVFLVFFFFFFFFFFFVPALC
jgi:Transcription initiation factor TFIID 23-30kDa subunit